MAITQECCKQYWTIPGDSIPQSSSCTATYHLSWKLSKLDEPDIRDTAGEVGMKSEVTYSFGPLHVDKQRQDDQLEPIYHSSVLIQDVDFEDLTEAMDNREGWLERVREIHAGGATWWWWYDSTWDWTLVSRAFGKDSNHQASGPGQWTGPLA